MAAVSIFSVPAHLRRLGWFTWQELLCCFFPVAIFLSLGLSHVLHIPGLPRYDLMLILCVGVQWLMIRLGMETVDELKAICVFHVLGLGLELYKVKMGSWAYPEPAYLKFGGVPLYGGFMHASIGSYVCQAWRRMDLHIENWPGSRLAVPLAVAIYVNFFTLHVIPDLRWPLILFGLVIFRRTWVDFRVDDVRARMPLALSFLLIGFFIWVAENIGSRLGAWRYPYQQNGWTMVHGDKIGSWGLLIIVTVVVVAQLKLTKEQLVRSKKR